MSITLTLTAPTPNKLDLPLSIAASFTEGIAAYQLGLVKDYLFGTSATGSAPVVPITNLTDLAANFNAQSDVGGTSVQNEELERFQAFNSVNHAFNSTDMSLTAALETAISADVVAKTLVGPVTTSAVLTFADTTGVVDNMMFATSSAAWVTATTDHRVVSHDATTVTLNKNVTLPDGALCEFLPCYIVPTVSAVTNSATLTFPAVPAAVVAGMFYTNITNGTFGTRRVLSTTATTVVLDGIVTVTAAALIFFQPPFTSGQIWTKVGYQPGLNGATYIAAELTCTVPQCTAGQSGTGRGSWPAFWLYPLTGGNGDEIDIFEFFNCLTAGSNAYTSNIHFGAFNRTDYSVSTGSTNHWSSGFYRGGTDYGLTQHKFQMIWTPNKIYRYIDGVLVISTDWITTSVTAQQIGCDLALGSTLPSFLQIFFYPRATAQFPMTFKINELKIWQG